MQVILTADVPNLGHMGDVVEVADGYGRNYLIPQRLAVQATSGQRRRFEHLKKEITLQSERLRAEARGVQGKLDGVSITLAKRTAGTDKLYGSVTNREIADVLAEAGYEVDRRQIAMEQAIKELGIYEVPIRLHSDVVANIRVWVIKM